MAMNMITANTHESSKTAITARTENISSSFSIIGINERYILEFTRIMVERVCNHIPTLIIIKPKLRLI